MSTFKLYVALQPANPLPRKGQEFFKGDRDKDTIHFGQGVMASSTKNINIRVSIREEIDKSHKDFWDYVIPYRHLTCISSYQAGNQTYLSLPTGQMVPSVYTLKMAEYGAVPIKYYFDLGGKVGKALLGDAHPMCGVLWSTMAEWLGQLTNPCLLEVEVSPEEIDGKGFPYQASFAEDQEGEGFIYQQLVRDEYISSVRVIEKGQPGWIEHIFPKGKAVDISQLYGAPLMQAPVQVKQVHNIGLPEPPKVGFKKVEPKLRKWWKEFFDSWPTSQKDSFTSKDSFTLKGVVFNRKQLVEKLIVQKCPHASLYSELTEAQQGKVCAGLAQWEQAKPAMAKPNPKAIQMATEAMQAGKTAAQPTVTVRKPKPGSAFTDD